MYIFGAEVHFSLVFTIPENEIINCFVIEVLQFNIFKFIFYSAGLILKLSVIMGISLIFEAVSGFIDMRSMGGVAKYVELIWDMINALQGEKS